MSQALPEILNRFLVLTLPVEGMLLEDQTHGVVGVQGGREAVG